MKKIESYYELDDELSKYNLSSTLYEISKITKAELDTPRTEKKTQELILNWWNNLKYKPKVSKHRLSYFCLYALRKEYNNEINKNPKRKV